MILVYTDMGTILNLSGAGGAWFSVKKVYWEQPAEKSPTMSPEVFLPPVTVHGLRFKASGGATEDIHYNSEEDRNAHFDAIVAGLQGPPKQPPQERGSGIVVPGMVRR